MRKIKLMMQNETAGYMEETENGYILKYVKGYNGHPLSLVLPVRDEAYCFKKFPPFLDGLLPEGVQLDVLLRKYKIDEEDYLSQIIIVGKDLVGAITVEEVS